MKITITEGDGSWAAIVEQVNALFGAIAEVRDGADPQDDGVTQRIVITDDHGTIKVEVDTHR